jgi:phage-related protein
MTYIPTFGSYALPVTLYPIQEPGEAGISVAKLARTTGARASTRLLTEKVIRLEGGLVESAGASLRTQIDALKAGLQGEQSLSFEADRLWRKAQMRDFEVNYEGTGYARFARVRLSFVTPDPYQYAASDTTNSRTITASGQTLNTTNAGNAPAAPVLSLTVGGSGAVTLSCTVLNNTTGESFTLNGSVTGGEVILIDTLEQSITISGVDKTALFDGLFPSLEVGSNTFQVNYTAGTISNLSLSHKARWY